MAIAAAGAFIKSVDIVDTASVVTLDTTIGLPAVNFTTITATARTMLNGALVNLVLFIRTTNAIAVTGTNITDVPIFTLDAPYRPSEVISVHFGTGVVDGECAINGSGVVTLRSANAAIAAAAGLLITTTYIIG